MIQAKGALAQPFMKLNHDIRAIKWRNQIKSVGIRLHDPGDFHGGFKAGFDSGFAGHVRMKTAQQLGRDANTTSCRNCALRWLIGGWDQLKLLPPVPGRINDKLISNRLSQKQGGAGLYFSLL